MVFLCVSFAAWMSLPLHTAVPKPTDDTYPQPNVGPTSVKSPGVRANDDIPCGSQAVLTVTSQPAYGTVVLQNSGAFVYTPTSSPNRDDTFEYQVWRLWRATTECGA